jgi:hypothetical protein
MGVVKKLLGRQDGFERPLNQKSNVLFLRTMLGGFFNISFNLICNKN